MPLFTITYHDTSVGTVEVNTLVMTYDPAAPPDVTGYKHDSKDVAAIEANLQGLTNIAKLVIEPVGSPRTHEATPHMPWSAGPQSSLTWTTVGGTKARAEIKTEIDGTHVDLLAAERPPTPVRIRIRHPLTQP